MAARGFNIDSLVVCNTEVEDLSRMTIVLTGQDGVVEQARRQLEDLVPVWAVLDYTNAPLVQRELLLAKVSILGPEFFEELLAHHREMAGAEEEDEGEFQTLQGEAAEGQDDGEGGESGSGGGGRGQQLESLDSEMERLVAEREQEQGYHPRQLAASQALRHKHEHLDHITKLTHQFGGKVLDISTNNCIVEL